ncbi:hypothetical protein BE17_02170 [Sorangium cellulosum]|uniref:Outer membrane lipoprotein BamD-like domain-containing protein n=1 Tax=Sorangium cellulosum TaxID=56 RepID=A0A150QTV0_SORCE|nr:hypothetical protein BE17_02170 [Sorangium cellulosum]
MTEPRRLLEESDSPLERALLSAGASYAPSQETRAKTLAALGLAGAAALSSAAAPAALSAAGTAAASSSLVAKLGWTKILVALSTVGALAGIPAGYLAWRGYHQPPASELGRFAGSFPDPIARAMPSSPPSSVGAGAAPVEAGAEEVAAPAPARSQSVNAAAKSSAEKAALQAELDSLDAARATLSSGNAQGALSLLDAYTREHPRGRLRLEAEVLRIDALAKSGRADAAAQRAEAFLRRHPNSVLASRVRRYVNN